MDTIIGQILPAKVLQFRENNLVKFVFMTQEVLKGVCQK